MFINAEPVFAILESYRLIHIAGKFGGHKTSLALAMFRDFGDRGYRLITNTKTIWADDMYKVALRDNGQLKAVVILDEGGQEFKTSRQIEMIASYARKMDVVYIIPSYWPPAKVPLTIQPLFSLKSAGLPVIFYQWRVDLGGMHDKGWFIWMFPEEIYGIYSSQDPGDYCAEIIDFLIKRAGEFRKFHGRSNSRNELQTLEEVKPEDVLADAMGLFAENVDALGASLSRRTSRKRR
jgi:hypothetical protein